MDRWLVTLLLADASPAAAGEPAFRVSPRLWFASVDSRIGTPRGSVETEASFADIWRNLDLAAMGTVEWRPGSLGLPADVVYTRASTERDLPPGASRRRARSSSSRSQATSCGGPGRREAWRSTCWLVSGPSRSTPRCSWRAGSARRSASPSIAHGRIPSSASGFRCRSRVGCGRWAFSISAVSAWAQSSAGRAKRALCGRSGPAGQPTWATGISPTIGRVAPTGWSRR